MPKSNIKSKQGFTIIEVVLVLAIAGLIFLMVFIALPALQRSQRDTQRRDDMARFMTQLSQYQANNGGKTPAQSASNVTSANVTTWNTFVTNYLRANGDNFTDPDGTNYRVGYVCVLSSASACSATSTAAAATGYPAAVAVLPNNVNTMQWSNEGVRNNIYVYVGAKCNGETITYVANSPRQIAIRYKLEGAGIYCSNN